MIRYRQKWAILLAMIVSLILTSTSMAVTKGQWAAFKKKDYYKCINEIEKNSFKDGSDWYVLGKSYYEVGKKEKALGAWKNAKQIADKFPKGTKKGTKYAHLFPPGSTKKEKMAIYNDFKTKYQSLAAAVAVSKEQEAKQHTYAAKQKELEAKRKLAEAKKLEAHAAAETKAAEQKRRLNQDKSKPKRYNSRPVTHRSSISMGSFFIFLFGVLGFCIVSWLCLHFLYLKPKQKREDEERDIARADSYLYGDSDTGNSSSYSSGSPAPTYKPSAPTITERSFSGAPHVSSSPQTRRRSPRNVNRPRPRSRSGRSVPGTSYVNVNYGVDPFMSPFWYMGHYYVDSWHFHRIWGHHYTNAMYMDNYDRWGHGQGRDLDLDDEIIDHIDDAEHLEKLSADAVEEAENLNIDAEAEEFEAQVDKDEASELEESMDFGEEATEDDFEDDEPAEEEFDAPEPEEPEDEWDEPEPEVEEFEPEPEPEEEFDEPEPEPEEPDSSDDEDW